MGQCVEKLAHSCGSRQGLQTFEQEDGKLTGYCFSCATFVPNPYGEEKTIDDIPAKRRMKKTKEEIQAELEEIRGYPTEDLRDRKLRKAALERYGVKLGFDEETGQEVRLHYYPYTKDSKLVAYKVRVVENKKMFSIGDQTDVDLFGWDVAVGRGAKRLVIVEGELDAVALDRILEMHTKAEWKDNVPAVCSLPHGAAGAAKDIARLAPKIRKHFKEVTLCFDDDEPGRKATEEVCKVLPEATTVTLPCKDANQCILDGKGKAAHKAVTFNAKKPKNTRLVWGREVHEAAKVPAQWGVPWPWDKLTQLTRGIRTGETYYLGAAQKMGKSEVVNTLGAWLIEQVGWSVMMAKPEEANAKTYKLVAGKIAGKIFHDPKVEFDEAAYDRAGEIIQDKLCMVNLYQHLGWDTLKADIHAAASDGCKAIFIDPITNLTNGMNAADANTKLQEIAQELAAMAKDLDVAIFIFCHLRNPDSGLSHDRGGHVLTSQFAGSRAMGRSCNYMFGLEGNKDPDLSDEERNVRHLVLLDDREFGEVGSVPLFWNKKTGLFAEM